MKGFVPTPVPIVDLMVAKLFAQRPPNGDARVLDPGCGEGEFIAGIVRWAKKNSTACPEIVGIESDPGRAAAASVRFKSIPEIKIRTADFLNPMQERFEYIIGNPPYVPITGLTVDERKKYRRRYATARGRFDLYLLFFEQALKLLAHDGRLVFITPEKFLYVDAAAPLRDILGRSFVEELHFLDEQTFGELVTYPLVSTISARSALDETRVIHRDRHTSTVRLGRLSSSWMPVILGHRRQSGGVTLRDAALRVSCGVATGADAIYVVRNDDLPVELAPFARPTISGRQIAEGAPLVARSSMLLPYDANGTLLAEEKLGALGKHLADQERRRQLTARTCASRKPWYAFHETPPLRDLMRPKLLCKDITSTPFFVIDRAGDIIPRHSTYYIVPANPSQLDELAEYLNSPTARHWLRGHCQRAANGFLRLQSQVLKQLPVPAHFAPPQDILPMFPLEPGKARLA